MKRTPQPLDRSSRDQPANRTNPATTNGRPLLDPRHRRSLRAVIRSCRAFDRRILVDLSVFRNLVFQHALFRGTGEQLMRYAGIKPRRTAYNAWITPLFLEAAAGRFLLNASRIHGISDRFFGSDAFTQPCEYDEAVRELREAGDAFCETQEGRHSWRALGAIGPFTAPDELLAHANMTAETQRLLETLSPMLATIVRLHLGFGDEEEMDLASIGKAYDLSRERIRQLYVWAIKELRKRAKIYPNEIIY